MSKKSDKRMVEGIVLKDICINKVTQLAVNELISFEQIEPFKRLARLLDDEIQKKLAQAIASYIQSKKPLGD